MHCPQLLTKLNLNLDNLLIIINMRGARGVAQRLRFVCGSRWPAIGLVITV